MNLDIGSKVQEYKAKNCFELVMKVRDSQGNMTDKIKSYSTNDASKLHGFWVRNSHIDIKNKKKKAKIAKTDKEITQALSEIEQHTSVIRRKRKLED